MKLTHYNTHIHFKGLNKLLLWQIFMKLVMLHLHYMCITCV